jgi:hypothetical protein
LHKKNENIKVMKTFIHNKSGRLYYAKTFSLNGQNMDSDVSKTAEQGNGWQLPSIDELEIIYEQLHQKEPGFFEDTIYWSSTDFNDEVAWYYDFRNGMDGTAVKILAAKIMNLGYKTNQHVVRFECCLCCKI